MLYVSIQRKDSMGAIKKYEMTVLVHPDLESDIERVTEDIVRLVEKAKGKVTKQDSWGKKRLAYQIEKQDFANYLYFELDLPATAPAKISNALNINKEIIRYLLVKQEQVASENDQEETK